MGRLANSMERGLASMSFCPQCGLQLPEGSSFCYQCGTHVREGEPIAPHLEADATPPPLGLAGAGEIPRFTPHAADEPTCRFCKGPLDLNGEFCEQCGAPVSEAAPSRWLKPAAVAHPVVSKEISPPEPSAARLAGPPPAKVTSPPATLSFAPSRSAPRHPEEKAIRTPPLNTVPPRRADQIRLPGGRPGKPATTLPATPSAPAQATSAQAFAPKAPAIEAPKVTVRQLPKTVAAPFPQTASSRKIAGPLPGTIPIVSVPLSVPVRGEELFPAQPKKPFPFAVPSAASLTGPRAAKATSSPATLSYAPSPSVPPRAGEKTSRTPPPNIPPPPRADQLRPLDGKPGKAATALPASPPSPAQATSDQMFAPKALAVEPPTVVAVQLGKTVAALMRQNAALREIAGPLPETTPIVSVPLSTPVRGEAVFLAQRKKSFPLVLVGGIAGLLLAIGMVAGWQLFHRKAHSARVENVTAQQVHSPAPLAEIAAPTLESVNSPSPASEVPEERPQAPAPARKSRRVKAATAAKPAPAVPATDPKTAQLVSLQNLALEACAKGNYAEPREASAIAYSQQALALDPSNDYTRTILENSIKGGEYQLHQAILSKDFTTAHRVADVLAQLLPGERAVGDLKTDLANAEKAEEESRRPSQVPAAVLSFRVYHMHSGKATGDKGSYCRGTLSVVAGRLKYVGETALDGQVHSFDIACSEVVEVKKNLRVAFWEKEFHVRTTLSNINLVPEDGSSSHIRALASACSR